MADSSCYVAVAFREPGWEEVLEHLAGCEQVVACPLLEAEVAASLRREGTDADLGELLSGIYWILPDRPLSAEIASVLAGGYLRGADTWHLAHALWLAPEGRGLAVLTLDEPQRRSAERLGFEAPRLSS